MTEFLKLAHLRRGSWFARAADTKSIARLGSDPLPILPDREQGALDWQAKPRPVYTARAEEGGADWWMAPEHEAWRRALRPGALAWVRQVMPDGRDDPAVCESKGLWRLGEAQIGPGLLRLELAERIGEVR